MKTNLVMLMIAALAAAPAFAADAAKGKEKSAACAACHGADGNSQSDAFPRIGGQPEDYLLHSLRAYKAGKRKNAIMAGQVANLNLADMKDLAAYYSSQHSSLQLKR